MKILWDRTEGWAAGISLLVSSLGEVALTDRDAFVGHLTKTDRYVFGFLAEEVLGRQESDTRKFLLESSILTELTPALCEAVTGRSDAQTLLEDLYRRNLFLVVDESGEIFHYHDLFREFLLNWLEKEMPEPVRRELHRRAAETEVVPSRAIRHYLDVGRSRKRL